MKKLILDGNEVERAIKCWLNDYHPELKAMAEFGVEGGEWPEWSVEIEGTEKQIVSVEEISVAISLQAGESK